MTLRVSQWDRDGNGRITREEFRQGLGTSNLFAQLDTNRNGAIEPNEIRTASAGSGGATASRNGFRYQQVAGTLYSRFDRNGDNRLTQNEYRANASNYFGDNDYFAAWDRDRNGWLSDREFGSGMQQAGLFRDWDGNNDGVIDRDEWTTAGNGDGLFGMVGDNDSLIGEDEGLF
ncbi:MAG TPA: hypothetical protein VD995_22515 [Azospirillum sp.]|nr:hypothetical protein [Azospirillum sp.]